MIKNINDLLSFTVLALLTIYSLDLLIYAYIKSKKGERDIDSYVSKWQLFLDYNDNTEE